MMINRFLHIRLKQFQRELNAIGILYVAILLAALGFGMLAFFKQMEKWPNAMYMTGLLLLPVLFIQLSRKDKNFVRNLKFHSWKVFAVEYLFFLSPFMILILFSKYWFLSPALAGGVLLLSFIPGTAKARNKANIFSRFIPPSNFEWKAGTRKSSWPILALYLASWGLAFLPFVSLVLLWVLTGVISSFYMECEPRHILEAQGLAAGPFIKKKLWEHLRFYWISVVPQTGLYAFFHPDLLWVPVLFLVFASIVMAMSIIVKYAIYSPNAMLSGNNILLTIALLSIFIPFLLPVPVIKSILDYPKVIKNLNPYLDAYH